MENSLFQLLRIGLEIEPTTSDALDLVSTLSSEHWLKLRDLAERQGVAAIALDGLTALFKIMGKSQ